MSHNLNPLVSVRRTELSLTTRQAAPTNAISIDALSAWMEVALAERIWVRPVEPADYDQLVDLERQLFPNTDAVFTASCIRSLSRLFPHAVLVAKGNSGRIESYVSFVPLGPRNLDYCVRNNVRSICHFSESWFSSDGNVICSFFFEALGTRQGCPFEIKWDVISIAAAVLKAFNMFPFLSCPVTDEGLRILSKLKFNPMDASGLHQLYVRGPWPALEAHDG
jgi:hypothetical protein